MVDGRKIAGSAQRRVRRSFLQHGSMPITCNRQALALAPWSKLLYGSDLGALPEAYWLGATQGKRAVAEALEGMVAEETLSEADAGEAARAILHGTAEALYRL